MKKTLPALILFLGMVHGVVAQSKFYRGSVGFQTGTIQYKGELGNDFYRMKQANPLSAITYSHYASALCDLRFGITMGSWGYRHDDLNSFDVDVQQYSLDLKIKLIPSDDPQWSPYIFGGIGVQHFDNWTLLDDAEQPITIDPRGNPILPSSLEGFQSVSSLGAGVQFRFAERVFLSLEERFVFPGTDEVDGILSDFPDRMLMHTLSLNFGLFPWSDSDGDKVSDKDDLCSGTPSIAVVDEHGCPVDTDLDGVADFEDMCVDLAGHISGKGCPDIDGDAVLDVSDRCPEHAGLISNQGCPDVDQDGLADIDDECPDVKGSPLFHGCPDSDEDGISDPKDKCATTEKGVKVDANGCALDKDNDGITDEKDACPELAGEQENNGCPVVQTEVLELFRRALTGIQFETGKDIIKKESLPILDSVAIVLRDNPIYTLNIYGHTDNVGDQLKNMALSDARAKAVANQLGMLGYQKQIGEVKGFGDTKPVADNATKEGRAMNRRVEFEIKF